MTQQVIRITENNYEYRWRLGDDFVRVYNRKGDNFPFVAAEGTDIYRNFFRKVLNKGLYLQKEVLHRTKKNNFSWDRFGITRQNFTNNKQSSLNPNNDYTLSILLNIVKANVRK